MTQLGDFVYAICAETSIIHQYFADTLSPLGEGIHVEGMRDPWDIAVCHHNRQLYVADYVYCIWRVSVDDRSCVKWLTSDTFHVWSLSLTSRRLLVTSLDGCLYQYSTDDGQLLGVVELPQFVQDLWYAAETARGTFVICHHGTREDDEQPAVSAAFTSVILCQRLTNNRQY